MEEKKKRMGEFYDIEFGSDFLDMIPKTQIIKEKSKQIELYQN